MLVADAPVANLTPASLRAFLAELGPAIGNLHDHIEASFFLHEATPSLATNGSGAVGGRPGVGAAPARRIPPTPGGDGQIAPWPRPGSTG